MGLHLRSIITNLRDAVLNNKSSEIINGHIKNGMVTCAKLLRTYGKNDLVAGKLKIIQKNLMYVWNATGKRMTAGKNKISRSVINKIDDMEEAVNEIGSILKIEFDETQT